MCARTGEGNTASTPTASTICHDQAGDPFHDHRPYAQRHVADVLAVAHRAVHVAHHAARQRRVEEQRPVVGRDRDRQRQAARRGRGDQRPPPGAAHRGQRADAEGRRERPAVDHPHPVEERAGADLPDQEGEDGDPAERPAPRPRSGGSRQTPPAGRRAAPRRAAGRRRSAPAGDGRTPAPARTVPAPARRPRPASRRTTRSAARDRPRPAATGSAAAPSPPRAGRTRRRPRRRRPGRAGAGRPTTRRWCALNAAATWASSGSAGSSSTRPVTESVNSAGRPAPAQAAAIASTSSAVSRSSRRRGGHQVGAGQVVRGQPGDVALPGLHGDRRAAASAVGAASEQAGSRSYMTQCCGPGSGAPASAPSSRCRSRGRGSPAARRRGGGAAAVDQVGRPRGGVGGLAQRPARRG